MLTIIILLACILSSILTFLIFSTAGDGTERRGRKHGIRLMASLLLAALCGAAAAAWPQAQRDTPAGVVVYPAVYDAVADAFFADDGTSVLQPDGGTTFVVLTRHADRADGKRQCPFNEK
jgi:hypothetical protein